MKVASMLESRHFTRFHLFVIHVDTVYPKWTLASFNLLLLKCQVERGKQVYYCYDDAELKKLQNSFPPNASYNIQRFKGEKSHGKSRN